MRTAEEDRIAGRPRGVPKVYLETSILNFVFADDSPEKKADTIKLFEEIRKGKYHPFTSEYVREEIGKASNKQKMNDMYELITEYNVNVLRNTEETERLAADYIKEGIISKNTCRTLCTLQPRQ